MHTWNESKRKGSMDLWNSQPLKVGSIGHGHISSSNPLNWCIKILEAVLYNSHAAKETHFSPSQGGRIRENTAWERDGPYFSANSMLWESFFNGYQSIGFPHRCINSSSIQGSD
jgi:hypothetical protein